MNDTNKLNGDDWVRLLKVFPQFAQYCNWEKLSRKNWIDLLEARPEFADKCGDIRLISDVLDGIMYKPIQRDIETLIESQNVERKERLWAFIPLGISFLLWGVGCIAFYCERATDTALIIWWTLFCSWNGVYYSLRKKNPESKWKCYLPKDTLFHDKETQGELHLPEAIHQKSVRKMPGSDFQIFQSVSFQNFPLHYGYL